MKVTIKTTQQKVFHIDLEGSETIAALKEKIQESQKHDVASQKIIYAGKILSDDKTVESCGIKEKDFLVLMVSKPKPTPAATVASTSTPEPVAAPAAPPAAALAPAASPPAPAAAAAGTPPPTAAPAAAPAFGDMSSFLSGEALQTTINNMTEMGFPRDQVQRALRASFNNPDRAVEYLMTGIPAHLEAEAAGNAQPAAPAAQPAAQPAAGAPAAAPAPAPAPAGQPQNLFQLAQQHQQHTGGASGNVVTTQGGQQIDIEALRNTDEIRQLREQMAANPDNIQALIQQLAVQHPQIAQVLAQNPEALAQVLGIPPQYDEEGGVIPPGAQVVSVTPEERAAIERLEALGFPRHAVLEAYFACDKNEELAANYLFEGGFED